MSRDNFMVPRDTPSSSAADATTPSFPGEDLTVAGKFRGPESDEKSLGNSFRRLGFKGAVVMNEMVG